MDVAWKRSALGWREAADVQHSWRRALLTASSWHKIAYKAGLGFPKGTETNLYVSCVSVSYVTRLVLTPCFHTPPRMHHYSARPTITITHLAFQLKILNPRTHTHCSDTGTAGPPQVTVSPRSHPDCTDAAAALHQYGAPTCPLASLGGLCALLSAAEPSICRPARRFACSVTPMH